MATQGALLVPSPWIMNKVFVTLITISKSRSGKKMFAIGFNHRYVPHQLKCVCETDLRYPIYFYKGQACLAFPAITSPFLLLQFSR